MVGPRRPPGSSWPSSNASVRFAAIWLKSPGIFVSPESGTIVTPATMRTTAYSQTFAVTSETDFNRFLGKGTAAERAFEALELGLRRQALAIAARLVAQRTNRDGSDHCCPSRLCPPYALPVRHGDRRPNTLLTALGELDMQRAYNRCGACGKGHFPRDEAFGIRRPNVSLSL